MSPSSREREREYARRRYEKWQERQQTKAEQLREARRRALLAIGAVAAVLGIVVGVLTYAGRKDDATVAAATPTGSVAASADANNPCKPVPGTKPSVQSFASAPAESLAQKKSWTMVIDTTCGAITVELDGAKAPKAVASTLFLAGKGFWNNTPCHRLTTEGIYVLQCGDPTGTGTGGPGYSYGPVENAPQDNVYKAGTLAMARQGGKATSMGSQFFLVYKDSTIPSDAAGGYTVFGKIIGGMDVVEKVAAGGVAGGGGDGSPARAVSITTTTVG